MSRHELYAALVAAGCLAAATPSPAVEVNPDGIGQVLLYPYYTARASSSGNAINTLLTVGNTTDHVKAVRVRFREGAVGAPVAEFNLYLGSHDMWTAAVFPYVGGGAALVTADRSCTVPAQLGPPQLFSNFAYIGDPLNGSIDRTKEGFVEIIEMGDYGLASAAAAGSVAEGVQPVGGVPLDCGRAQADIGTESHAGTGGLFGRAILINVGDGTEFSYPATALANFNATRSLWAAGDAPGPTLADVDPPISVVHSYSLGTIRTQWTQSIDATSAVLMHASLTNEFVIDPAIRAITDWVITLPTKYFYVNAGLTPTRLFQSPLTFKGACELVQLPTSRGLIFDRESTTVGVGFNDLLPPPPLGALCWAATVAGFSGVLATGETLFGSINPYEEVASLVAPASASPAFFRTSFLAGWMTVPLHAVGPNSPLTHFLVGDATTVFHPDGSMESRPQATYYGLPVIGFAAESYTNGTLVVNGQTVLSNYGGLIGHRYTHDVQ
jgi:hypothetical protein